MRSLGMASQPPGKASISPRMTALPGSQLRAKSGDGTAARTAAASRPVAVWRFLPHISRISTNFRPKSLAMTEQAWSKSWEISSEITEILKGELDAGDWPKSGRVAHAAAVRPAPARKFRLDTAFMFLL